MPKVTIIMPAYNESPQNLRESIKSIVSQTFTDFECILIDESTDNNLALACKEICDIDNRICYIHPDKRLGLAESLNLGISKARASLIARFDSDDICIMDRLERQVAFMDEHKEIGLVGGALEIIDGEGRTYAYRSYPLDHDTIERKLQTTTPIAHPTVMLRKSLIEQHGGYDKNFCYSEDLDLWLRLANRGVRFANLPEVLVRYRQQQTNRNPLHWEYNLRARKCNFTMRYLPYRLLGLFGIYVWGKMPSGIQKYFFNNLLLRRQSPSSKKVSDE